MLDVLAERDCDLATPSAGRGVIVQCKYAVQTDFFTHPSRTILHVYLEATFAITIYTSANVCCHLIDE